MKKILIPFFMVTGTASYPADVKYIHGELEFNGSKYHIATGKASAENGADTYADYELWLSNQPAITGIRVIKTRSFFERMNKPARRKLAKSNDDDVQDVVVGIGYLNYVDLDSDIAKRDVATLVTANILPQNQADKLFRDGTEEEQYNGAI